MNKLTFITILCGVVCGLNFQAFGQSDSSASNSDESSPSPVVVVNPPPPQTSLEKCEKLVQGVVIIKGYTDIGKIQADREAFVQVTAVEFSPAGQSAVTGVIVAVHQGGHTPRTAISYIDSDEIEALSAATDTLAHLDNNVTTLANYEAAFRTRGNLELSNLLVNGGRTIAIKSTQILPTGQMLFATAYLRPAILSEIKQQLLSARQALEHGKDTGK